MSQQVLVKEVWQPKVLTNNKVAKIIVMIFIIPPQLFITEPQCS
jgi:hypothetical protein